MKLSDLSSALGLTVEEYYYECYDAPEHGGIEPVQSFERRDKVQAYVVKSNTKTQRGDTLYGKFEAGAVPFERLSALQFYFVILVQSYKPDMTTVPDEVFLTQDDAAFRARELLKKYHKR